MSSSALWPRLRDAAGVFGESPTCCRAALSGWLPCLPLRARSYSSLSSSHTCSFVCLLAYLLVCISDFPCREWAVLLKPSTLLLPCWSVEAPDIQPYMEGFTELWDVYYRTAGHLGLRRGAKGYRGPTRGMQHDMGVCSKDVRSHAKCLPGLPSLAWPGPAWPGLSLAWPEPEPGLSLAWREPGLPGWPAPPPPAGTTGRGAPAAAAAPARARPAAARPPRTPPSSRIRTRILVKSYQCSLVVTSGVSRETSIIWLALSSTCCYASARVSDAVSLDSTTLGENREVHAKSSITESAGCPCADRQ